MAKENRKMLFLLGIAALTVYTFIAARPVRQETIIKPRWITSLESNYPVVLGEDSGAEEAKLLPFTLGNRYGYIADNGKFAINKVRQAYVSLSADAWAEYGAVPSSIEVINPENETSLLIENAKGYPLFLDNRVFIVGSEQNSLAAIGSNGETLWVHDFPAPLTCIDAAGGFVLAGTLDGAVELLDSNGKPAIPSFEPGGSRLSVILGCAISRDALRLAVISGIDEQRFLLLEKSGDSYNVVYHEFLKTGFRRPVHIGFVDNDRRVAFEREGGMGIFDIDLRAGVSLSLDGEITALDSSGGDRFLFVITSLGREKRFIVIRYPGIVVTEAPYRSDTAFFARRGNKLYLGGEKSMVSFELERK